MKADMHCHSRHSDSSVPVRDLIQMAKLSGVSAIAVTDHDTYAGQEEALYYGEKIGVEVIPGIELSGYDFERKQKSHILCYYPKDFSALDGVCREVHDHREEVTRRMIRIVAEHYPITEAMVEERAKDSTSIYKQHIMHALIDAGCTREFFGDLNRELFNHKDGIAYIKIVYPDVYRVLEAAKASGGVIVVAHPGESRQKGLLEELASKGLIDGVELYCPKNDEQEIARVLDIAKRYDLLLTGGTDFHGMYSNRSYRIGTFTAPWEWLQKLKDLAARK